MRNIVPTRVRRLLLLLCRLVKKVIKRMKCFLLFFFLLCDSILSLDKSLLLSDVDRRRLRKSQGRAHHREEHHLPIFSIPKIRVEQIVRFNILHTIGQVRLDKSTDCDRGGAARRGYDAIRGEERDVSGCRYQATRTR